MKILKKHMGYAIALLHFRLLYYYTNQSPIPYQSSISLYFNDAKIVSTLKVTFFFLRAKLSFQWYGAGMVRVDESNRI